MVTRCSQPIASGPIPCSLRSLKQNILSALPKYQITQGGQILSSVHNSKEVIACKRPYSARERGGIVRDEYLGLADASRIPEDVAALWVTSMVFEFGQLSGVAQRNSGRLATPPRLNEFVTKRKHLPKRFACFGS